MGIAAIFLALSSSLLWGGNSAAVKFSVDALPPVSVAAVRFGLASLFMVAWCLWAGTDLGIRRKHLLAVGIGGLLHYAQIIAFNFGVHWSNATHSVVLINAFVFVVVAIDHFAGFGPRMTRSKWIGLLLAAAGVALVFNYSSRPHWPEQTIRMVDLPSRKGDLVILVSAFLLSLRFVWIKKWVETIEPANFMLWQFAFSVLLFVGTSLLFEQADLTKVNAPAFFALLYQGLLVGGFCFAVQAALLKRYSATQVAIFSFTTPLFGVAASALTRDDPLSPWLLVSVVLISWGIYLVQRP